MPKPDPYVCEACGSSYVVPSLAVDCLDRCTQSDNSAGNPGPRLRAC